MTDAKETAGQVEYYARAMKAHRSRESALRLARDASWTHEEYLAAVLSRGVTAREASVAETRARASGFPGQEVTSGFSCDHQPGLKRESIAHLASRASLAEASNVVLPGPTGTGHPCLGGARFTPSGRARNT